MRILHEYNYKGWKITLFRHQLKVMIQIEDGPLRQSYRLNDPDSLEPLQELDSEFVMYVRKVFDAMKHCHARLMSISFDQNFGESDDII